MQPPGKLQGSKYFSWKTAAHEDSKLEEEEQQRRTTVDWSQTMPDALCHVAGQGRGVEKLRFERKEEQGGILGFVFASHYPTPF